MNADVITAIGAAVAAILAGVASVYSVIIAGRQKTQGEAINGRLSQLLEATGIAKEAEGYQRGHDAAEKEPPPTPSVGV